MTGLWIVQGMVSVFHVLAHSCLDCLRGCRARLTHRARLSYNICRCRDLGIDWRLTRTVTMRGINWVPAETQLAWIFDMG